MKKTSFSKIQSGRRQFIQTISATSFAFTSAGCATRAAHRSETNIPHAQNYTVAIKAPGSNHDEGYIYFSGFARLSKGAFIVFAVIDQPNAATKKGIKGHQGRIILSRSDNGGKTWNLLDTNLNFGGRMMGGALFVYENSLYMFVSPIGNDGILSVARSNDEGLTWTDWVEVIRIPRQAKSDANAKEERQTAYDDPNWSEGEKWIAYLQTAMAVKNGRLYLSVSERTQDMAIVSCDLARGLLNKAAWKISETAPVSIPKELNPGLFPGPSMSTLEGNVIEIDGKLRLLARQVIDRYGTSNIAAVFDVTETGDKPQLNFVQFFPIPGAHGLFKILYDDISSYSILNNPCAPGMGKN
jgi:hypothetical protein